MTSIRAFFSPKFGHFFPIFEKGQGRPLSSPPFPHQLRASLSQDFTSNIFELHEPKTGGKRKVKYNFLDLTRLNLAKIFRTQKFKQTEMHKLLIKLLGRFQSPRTSKMEVYTTVVNDFQPLTDVAKSSILDVEGDLKSASVIIHIITAISVTEPHLKFI